MRPDEQCSEDPTTRIRCTNRAWWTFRIFPIFMLGGGGRGSPRRQGVGRFLMENPCRGGSPGRGGGGRVREGVGRLNIFSRGRNSHQEKNKYCSAGT